MNLFTTNNPSFPAGLRVLAVDHDTYDFYTIHHICNQLHYQVTSCSTISQAKQLLSTSHFDIILVETHIPQQDTYAFVQQVTSHLKIPVIMMSLDNRTCSVMDSISNGACSYWAKPLDENLFKNMWQHVVRQHLVQKESEAKGLKKLGREHLVQMESEAKGLKKRGRDDEVHVSKQPPAKKARFSWTDDLHQKFVSAVNHLGIKKAKPKKVLKIMDCPGLELQHVASHLQKYKMYLDGGIKNSKMNQKNNETQAQDQEIDETEVFFSLTDFFPDLNDDDIHNNNYAVSAESIDSPSTSLPQLGQYSMTPPDQCDDSDIFSNLTDLFPNLNDEIHNGMW
ncbi:two-component response regulator ARR14-like [Trifolium pratense]|uniref:two-component response regulator ARR14-like n=1 Tax=Trifolium pratense TaxID=57577 RepID=UPI001E696DB9|nr:two-component response regulator ARR14-like [Trifolium pratense]